MFAFERIEMTDQKTGPSELDDAPQQLFTKQVTNGHLHCAYINDVALDSGDFVEGDDKRAVHAHEVLCRQLVLECGKGC